MARKRIKLGDRAHRALLSDTLPFEVPVSFSNRNFYALARDLDIVVADGVVRWKAPDARADVAIRLLFNIAITEVVATHKVVRNRKEFDYRSLSLPDRGLVTIPFQFNICHRSIDFRTLSVPHPTSQLAAAAFLDRYSSTIIYHCSRSDVSIRAPSSVARYTYHADRLHQTKLYLDENIDGVEEEDHEYEQLGSFFVYRKYNNIYKFFESPQYHRAERRFNAMVQLDISRCFDSIYTHSLAWALLGKPAVKAGLGASNKTFPGQFDEFIRSLNHNETNGIVIGPEFSRIYAECLLQKVDETILSALDADHNLSHKRHYRIFRYLDDYFIFFNEESTYQLVYELLGNELAKYKLALNVGKMKRYDKPIITELTIAKNGISELLSNGIKAELKELPGDIVPPTVADVQMSTLTVESEDSSPSVVCDVSAQMVQDLAVIKREFGVSFQVDSRKVIVALKTTLKQAGVSYLEIGNYAFALLEKSVARLSKKYDKANHDARKEDEYVEALVECFEICFFIYAATPRVNLSIRLVRIINDVVEHCNKVVESKDLKHHLFKLISDNVVHQIKKNRVLKFKEVENLYLLLGLACLGRDYWIEEGVLATYLGIKEDSSGALFCKESLNYFVVTSSLYYMREKVRYRRLRAFIIDLAVRSLEAKAAYRFEDTECLMLFLDLISCPYVDDAIKDRIASIYNLQRADWTSLNQLSSNWFTSWRGLKIGDALDAKRSRDVY